MEESRKVVAFTISRPVKVGRESLGRITVQLNDRAGYTREEANALADGEAANVVADIERRRVTT